MGLVVPDTAEVEILTYVLTPALTIRLYGNDVIPSASSTAASFNEISGGGYANKPLTFANWGIVSGNPTMATYPLQTWTFTGTIDAPGSVYGYYVTRNSDGKLMWAERFPAGVVPFAPQVGSVIKITPRFSGQSVY